MTAHPEPQLAPPGAGLPRFELFVARLLMAWRRRESVGQSAARFRHEREAVARLVDGCDPGAAGVRVLIKRPVGLEDSSRFWSIWMVLDHLRIIHHATTRVIQALTHGSVPEKAASTAGVKPSPAAGPEVRASYEESCDLLLTTANDASDLRTTLRYAHPWFGPLNAAGWFSMAGSHLGLHRGQMTRILAELARQRQNQHS